MENRPFPFAQSANLKDFTIPPVRILLILGLSGNPSDLGVDQDISVLPESFRIKLEQPNILETFKLISCKYRINT